MDGWIQNTCKFPTVKNKTKQTNKKKNPAMTSMCHMCMGYKIGKEKEHDKM